MTPAPTGTPGGTVSFYSGSTLLGTGDVNSSGVATFTSTSLSAGDLSITAVYSGNAAAAASTSGEMGLEVATTFGVTAPSTPFTVKAGGAVDIDITVPPLGGAFDSVVIMSASGLPAGATATFTPPTVIPGASGATTVLTIQTAARTAGIPAHQRSFPFAPLTLAAGLCVMAGRRKRLVQVPADSADDRDPGRGDVHVERLQRGILRTSPERLGHGHRHQRGPACFHHVHPDCEVRGAVILKCLQAKTTTGQMADKDKSRCAI